MQTKKPQYAILEHESPRRRGHPIYIVHNLAAPNFLRVIKYCTTREQAENFIAQKLKEEAHHENYQTVRHAD